MNEQLSERFEYYLKKGKEITKLAETFKKKEAELVEDGKKRASALECEVQDSIANAGAELRKAQEQYKAEMKAEFGLCDGEPIDVLSMLIAVSALLNDKNKAEGCMV